jgi:cell division protein FtsN
MEDSLDEPGPAPMFPPDSPRPKRDHSLLTIGVIVAVLITTLVVLPFVVHARHASRQTISSSIPGSVAPGASR